MSTVRNTWLLILIQVNSVTSQAIDFTVMADAQRTNEDLSHYRHTDSSLILRDVPLPTQAGTITCDISTGHDRPFVPATMCRQVFDTLHGLSHPGVGSTVKLITDRFVWPHINRDFWRWVQSCLPCQRAKIHRHTVTSPGTFTTPDARFSHVHIDLVGPLPPSNGSTYLLTCIDSFTRWPVAVSIPDTCAETVVKLFCRTGCLILEFLQPSLLTVDPNSSPRRFANSFLSSALNDYERQHTILKQMASSNVSIDSSKLPSWLSPILLDGDPSLGVVVPSFHYQRRYRLHCS
ncbi:hypothetical protein SprV_0401515300 [Sparganum proliferum]